MRENVIANYNVRVFGHGNQPLLFVHGLACDQNVWNYITPSFENDYKIILFDQIGSGKSDLKCYDKTKYSSLKGYANDVLSICDVLKLKDVILVTHSVSCMIGLYAAIERPALFSSLIMMGPSPYYLNDHGYIGGFEKEDINDLLAAMKENYTEWVEWFAPKVMGNPKRPDLTAEIKEIFCEADPAVTFEFAKVAFLSDSRSDLPFLKTRTLIMQLSEDLLAPQSVGKYLEGQIAESKLCCMKATGHFPHLSAPAETIKIMKEYLKGLNT